MSVGGRHVVMLMVMNTVRPGMMEVNWKLCTDTEFSSSITIPGRPGKIKQILTILHTYCTWSYQNNGMFDLALNNKAIWSLTAAPMI